MFGYVYKTICLVNGKYYIGQHVAPEFDTNYIGSGIVFLRAVKKHGKKNFICELIESCETQEVLDEREQRWISYYNSTDPSVGYNILAGGRLCGCAGYKHTDEYKVAMSEKKRKYKWYHKGDYYTTFSDDVDIPEGFVPGKPPVTAEMKQKISNTLKSRNLKAYKNEELRKTIYLGPEEAIPDGYTPGRYIDPEAELIRREKLRVASTGQTHTCPEHLKEQNRKAQLGTKCYTDGQTTIKLKPEDQIPEGFYPGVAITKAMRDSWVIAAEKNRAKGRHCSDYAKERSRQAHLGVTPVNAKKVFCEDTDKLYTSISSASKDTTVPANYIQKALKTQDKATIKYKGKYYTFEVRDE